MPLSENSRYMADLKIFLEVTAISPPPRIAADKIKNMIVDAFTILRPP